MRSIVAIAGSYDGIGKSTLGHLIGLEFKRRQFNHAVYTHRLSDPIHQAMNAVDGWTIKKDAANYRAVAASVGEVFRAVYGRDWATQVVDMEYPQGIVIVDGFRRNVEFDWIFRNKGKLIFLTENPADLRIKSTINNPEEAVTDLLSYTANGNNIYVLRRDYSESAIVDIVNWLMTDIPVAL